MEQLDTPLMVIEAAVVICIVLIIAIVLGTIIVALDYQIRKNRRLRVNARHQFNEYWKSK
jgi:uncharacterized membrane protein